MMVAMALFYLFAGVLIGSALLTLLSRNPVHSVLWLILAFLNAAGLMVMLGAEFIAMVVVIVYVGAVAVLFLFVVMMLHIREWRRIAAREWPMASLVGGVRLLQLLILAATMGLAQPGTAIPGQPGVSNIVAFGQVLFTRYLLIFETAGLILLVALIGAVALTRGRAVKAKRQRILGQVARRPKQAVRLESQPVGEGVELATSAASKE